MKTNVKYIALMTIVMSLIWMISAGVFMGMVGAVDTADIDTVESA